MAEKMKDKDFYSIHDGKKGRSEGIYLDEVERRAAEVHRARLEDREPDLDNPPAVVGTPLVVKRQLVDNSLISNPDREFIDLDDEDEDSHSHPVVTLPVDESVEAPPVDLSYLEMVKEEEDARTANEDDIANANTEVEAETEARTTVNHPL